jgi:hypothetical protein
MRGINTREGDDGEEEVSSLSLSGRTLSLKVTEQNERKM